jgi:hypothetical protein
MKKRGSVPLFVLAKLNKRAETTDTILYYVSDLRTDIEEMLLSIYEGVLEVRNTYNIEFPETPVSMKTVNDYMDTFCIIQVPYIGG